MNFHIRAIDTLGITKGSKNKNIVTFFIFVELKYSLIKNARTIPMNTENARVIVEYIKDTFKELKNRGSVRRRK